MDRRALPLLVATLAAVVLAVAAAVIDTRFGAAAAIAALAAGCFGLRVVSRLRLAEQAVEEAATAVAIAARAGRGASGWSGDPSRSTVDADTGLPGEAFFVLSMERRVAAARRHLWPVTVLLLELVPEGRAAPSSERVAAFSSLLGRTLREADGASRLGPATFGVLLEDTSEGGGVWTAERVRAAMHQSPELGEVVAAVASYPAHGLRYDEVLARAFVALGRAREAGAGKVEIAVAAESQSK